MHSLTKNAFVALAALAVPITAQFAGINGFSVLVYEPFNYAYFLLVSVIFVFINIYTQLRTGGSVVAGGLVGMLISLLWFGISFLVVGELHLRLGSKL